MRPLTIQALCLLSFVGSTIGFALYLSATLFFNEISIFIVKFSSWSSVDKISPLYFLILSMLNVVSFYGVLRIWQRHLDGVIIYSTAQIAILFLPVLWIDWHSLSIINVIFTSLFICGYIANSSWLMSLRK